MQLFDDSPYVDPDAPGAADADAVIEDDALATAAPGAPPYLSPSSASMYQGCPRRWQYRYVERRPDPPGEAALAGTFAHRVLELLFQHEPPMRTRERARTLAREAWPETEAHPAYVALGLDDDRSRAFRWKGWQAIEGLWAVEDPASVQVRATEQLIDTEVGGVPFRGVIDRLDITEHSYAITDYKSGRAPSVRFADSRLSQVLLYAAAVETVEGTRPELARLVYLGQRVIDVAVTDEVIAPVVDTLRQTWQSVNDDCARREFQPKPGPLCAWCPYASHCSEGQAEVMRRYDLGLVPASAPAVSALALPLAS